MEIKINGKKYKAKGTDTVLDVCRREHIRIPTLCAHGELKREMVCRLCLVEISGRLVSSCSTPVTDGMEVITESATIKKAREVNMDLLWSDHAGKCAACKKNRMCELQKLAEEYKIENFHFVPRRGELTEQEELDMVRENWSRVVVDEDNPVISRTTEYCVECRRCINICPIDSYGFNHRAGDTVVGTPYEKTLDCLFCGACVKHCPTAALTDKNFFEKIEEKLADLKIMAVAIVDPAVVANLTAVMKMNEGKLAGLLKKMGFERVFSLETGWELFQEKLEGETKRRTGKPVFSGHCPAFRRLIAKKYPSLKSNLSQTDIPDELMADFIKNEYARQEKINKEAIFAVSISSCTAKKTLVGRSLDAVLTAREISRYIRDKKIDSATVKSASYDKLKDGTAAKGQSSIKAGGLLASLHKRPSLKKMNGVSVNGIKKLEKILEKAAKGRLQYDFIEATICPGGCLHGGGLMINDETGTH